MHLSVILLLSPPLAGGWWVGLPRLTYEEARAACFPGDLASFSTNQELSELLWTSQELQSALKAANHSAAFFWVGLQKPKDLCVIPGPDQRGFRFVDGRQDSKLSVWREEPRDTCTNVRCGAVAVDSGSWGLVSLSCKIKNHFICGPPESGPRLQSTPESKPKSKPESRPKSTPERPAGTREPNQEQTRLSPDFGLDPGLGSEESPNSGLSPEPEQMGPTFGPQPGLPSESKPPPEQSPDQSPDQYPSPHPSPEKSEQHPHQTSASAMPSPGSSPGSGLSPGLSPGSSLGPDPSCPLPLVPGSRFLYDSEPGQVSVECWSGEVLLLRCVHGVWTRTRPDSESGPDPSPVSDLNPDLSLISDLNSSESQYGPLSCSDCGPGFRFRGGQCEDIDECALSPAPCEQGCVNTHGSFTCTPAPLSKALVHSLIAVAAVMLAVIAVVTIWCCIRKKRRDQKPDQDLNQNQTEA